MTPISRARRLMLLVEEGFAGSLSEAAIRFAISQPAMGTILVGMASPQQFEQRWLPCSKVRCRWPRWTVW